MFYAQSTVLIKLLSSDTLRALAHVRATRNRILPDLQGKLAIRRREDQIQVDTGTHSGFL
jgi:hypothetical protein